jgi:O-antigen/teichoic acid export membrane protein
MQAVRRPLTGAGRRAYSRSIASSLAVDSQGARPGAPDPAFPGLAGFPEAGRRSAATDAALVTVAIYGSQALLFVAGVVQKGLLGPTNAGYWALMGTFMTFFSLLALGAFDGATRQVPTHRGRKEWNQAAAVSNSAATFTLAAMAVGGLAVAAGVVGFGQGMAPPLRWGIVILALTAPLRALVDCHDLLIQMTKRFDASAAGLLLRAGVTISFQTLFVLLFGYYGMFMGLVLGAVLVLWMWARMDLTGLRRPAFRLGLERRPLGEAIGVGVPIMVQGQTWYLFLAIDNLIVAAFIDVKNLGYYALAVSVTSYVVLLPKSIGQALFPRMLERFAQSRDIRSIRHYATDVQRILAYLLVPPAIASLYFLLPVLVRQALPSFEPAIPVIHVMVAGSFFIAIAQMPTEFLITTGYRWQLAGLGALALAINAGANYFAVAVVDGGIRGAAIATSASYAALFLIVSTYALGKAYTRREVWLHIAELLGVFAYLMASVWGVELLLGPGGGSLLHDVAIGIAKLAICLVLLAPWFVLAQRRYRAFSTIAELLRSAVRTFKAWRARSARGTEGVA